MAKYNLVFFLDEETITTNEIGTNGGLQTVKVKGFKKYEYERAKDFTIFFEALKDDAYGISSFSESEFYATILNMGFSQEVVDAFKEHLADCKEVTVLDAEISKALIGNSKEETERLEKVVEEKDNEIHRLNNEEQQILDAKKKKIAELEAKHAAAMEELEEKHKTELEDCKKQFGPKRLEPKRTIIRSDVTGKISNACWWAEHWCKLVQNNVEKCFVPAGIDLYGIKYSENNYDDKVEKYIKNPTTGFLFRFADDGDNIDCGDVLAVISSDLNDTKETIKDWLKENDIVVKPAEVKPPVILYRETDRKDCAAFRNYKIEKILSEGAYVNKEDCIAKLHLNATTSFSCFDNRLFCEIKRISTSTSADSEVVEMAKGALEKISSGEIYISVEAPCSGTLHYVKDDEVGDGEVFAEII